MEYHFVIILVACLIGLFMAWGVGANDLANVMSTTMGSKAISVRQAMFIAIIFEFAGAFLGGVHVTDTIRNGIINTQLFTDSPQILAEGMLATLIAGMTWIIFASTIGMPVSITNSIIGAIIGFGSIVLGVHAIHWHTVQLIAVSWICSPMIAGLFGYFLFVLVRKTILAADNPCHNAKKYMPIYFFFVGVVFALMAILRDLSRLGYKPSFLERSGLIVLTGLVVMLVGRFFSHRIQLEQSASRHECYSYIEKLFGILMGFTACTMVFAHGSNDVGVAIGPIIAIVSIMTHQPLFSASHTITYGLMAMGCFVNVRTESDRNCRRTYYGADPKPCFCSDISGSKHRDFFNERRYSGFCNTNFSWGCFRRRVSEGDWRVELKCYSQYYFIMVDYSTSLCRVNDLLFLYAKINELFLGRSLESTE